MNDKIYLTNRSAAETDDQCGMKFWWSQEEDSTGIVPKVEADALRIGGEIHEDLEGIARMEDISVKSLEEITEMMLASMPVSDREDLSKMEVLYRRLGWLIAYALYIEPQVRSTYETLSIEDELILDRTPLWVAVTPDRVLRHRKDGYYCYREYKSTISASQKWLQSWSYAIQLHIGLKAIEEEFSRHGKPIKMAYAQIMGLMKGDTRDNRLSHPYVWAYRNDITGDWTEDYQKARSATWHKAPIWEYPDGIVKWVQRLGEAEARQQFPHTSPVMLNERMLNAWVARRLAREIEIDQVRAECVTDWEARTVYFEPRTRNCRPAFGDSCPYLGLCWNASLHDDPQRLNFIKRTPHHEVEALFEQ